MALFSSGKEYLYALKIAAVAFSPAIIAGLLPNNESDGGLENLSEVMLIFTAVPFILIVGAVFSAGTNKNSTSEKRPLYGYLIPALVIDAFIIFNFIARITA